MQLRVDIEIIIDAKNRKRNDKKLQPQLNTRLNEASCSGQIFCTALLGDFEMRLAFAARAFILS